MFRPLESVTINVNVSELSKFVGGWRAPQITQPNLAMIMMAPSVTLKKSFVVLVAQDSPVHQRWFVRRRGHWSLASNQRQDGHCIVTFVVNAITKHRFFIAAVNEVRSYSFAVILRISMRQERINDTDTLASYKPPNYKMTIRKYLFALLSFYFGQSRTLTKLLPSQW